MRTRFRSALRGPRRDAGAATIEQLGVVVVAVLLVLGGVTGVATYGPHLATALCRLSEGLGLGGGCDSGTDVPEAQGPTDEDFRPPVCTLRSTTDVASTEVKIFFVTIGEDSGFTVVENSDGTVTATATNGGSLGVEGGFGVSVGSEGKGDIGLGADVSFGAGVSAKVGDTWTFKSKAEWEKMRGQLDDYLVQEMQMKGEGAAGIAIYKWLSDSWVEAPRKPDVTTTVLEVSGTVDGQAGLRLGDGTKTDGKPDVTDLNRGLYVEGKVAGSYVRTENHATGETSNTYQFDASGGGGLNWGFGNAGLDGAYQNAFKVTRDKDDNIVGVEFMQETSAKWSAELDLDSSIIPAGQKGNGSASFGASKPDQRTVVTTELSVNDSNRATVEKWLAESALGGSGPVLFPSNALDPSTPGAGDPMSTLLHSEAKHSVNVYDDVESGFSFGAEFAVGIKLGASLSSSSTSSSVSSSMFLGAPGTDGTRRYVPDATCKI